MRKVSWAPRDPSRGCDRAHGFCGWTVTVRTRGVGGRVEGPVDAHGRWAPARTEGLAETVTPALGPEELRPGPEVLSPVTVPVPVLVVEGLVLVLGR